MTKPILEFRGDYRFLSNFVGPLDAQGRTVEHYFQAAKAPQGDNDAHARVLNGWMPEAWASVGRGDLSVINSPGAAKKAGRTVPLRADWDRVKFQVMAFYVGQKFLRDAPENRALAGSLLETGTALLVEGNTWGDTYWGVDLATGVGENNLGKILMSIRGVLYAGLQVEKNDAERASEASHV